MCDLCGMVSSSYKLALKHERQNHPAITDTSGHERQNHPGITDTSGASVSSKTRRRKLVGTDAVLRAEMGHVVTQVFQAGFDRATASGVNVCYDSSDNADFKCDGEFCGATLKGLWTLHTRTRCTLCILCALDVPEWDSA